jgi:hypothetical protein
VCLCVCACVCVCVCVCVCAWQVDAVRAFGIAGNTSIPSLQHPPFLCLVGTPLGADESNIC